MRPTRAFMAVSLAALLVLAGCASPLQSTEGPTASTAETPTISVSGTGEVTADADLAVVSVAVVATADSANAAREAVARDATAMRTALRDAGVADDAVTTLSYNVYPEYDYSGEERRLVGYRAVHAYRIEVAPGDAGSVIDAAVGNGADEVYGVQFTLTDETRQSLREEALTRAMTDARADADTIAAASDLSISGVHTVSTAGDVQPYAPRFESGAAAGDASTTLEPGPVTVSASVSVTYTAA